MGVETFDNTCRQVMSAGYDVFDSVYKEDSFGYWCIVLDTSYKIRLVWDSRKHLLRVEEETGEQLNELTVWKRIYVANILDHNKLPATVEEILIQYRQ